VNICTTCGEDFGGIQAFDAHRVGSHAYSDCPTEPDGRRSLSVTEMLARGLAKNSRGRWSLPQSQTLSTLHREQLELLRSGL
jgi:hypothetical protein